MVELFTFLKYRRFEARLRVAGFRDHGGMSGRFLFGGDDRQLDVIPADASILGFENRRQRDSPARPLRQGIYERGVVHISTGLDTANS